MTWCSTSISETYLPTTTVERFRMLWVDRDTGRSTCNSLTCWAIPSTVTGIPAGAIELELTRIPFVLLDIGDSMIKDVVNHQIASLNLGSGDVNYALKAELPLLRRAEGPAGLGQPSRRTPSAKTDGDYRRPGCCGERHQGRVTQGRTYHPTRIRRHSSIRRVSRRRRRWNCKPS